MADAVISRVAATASYVALGYLLQRVGAVKRDDGRVMLRFVVQVTLPALLLHTLTHSGPLFGPGTPLVFMIAVLASAIVTGGSYLLYRRRPSYERGLLVGCATGVNLGTFQKAEQAARKATRVAATRVQAVTRGANARRASASGPPAPDEGA